MLGNYDELINLEIFNTPYKIKVKGFIETTYQGVDIYILETHGKVYALEMNDNHNDFILHDDLETAEDLKLILKIGNNCYKLDELLTINQNELPWYSVFDSNVFSIENVSEKKFDILKGEWVNITTTKAILQDEIKEKIKEKPVSKQELTKHVFGIEPSIQPLTLEDLIEHTKKKVSTSEESEDNDDMTNSMGCRTPLYPTLEDLIKNLEEIEKTGAKLNDEVDTIAKLMKKYSSHEER